QQRGLRHDGAHLFLDALRADPEMLDPNASAFRAVVRWCSAPSTAVAHQRAVDVIRERDIAGGTVHNVAAVSAQHDGREAATIEIEDRLIAFRDRALEC